MNAVRLLPKGLDTQLNTAGRPLSYGQARRLMVARALAARPRLIVLDDVLDELDAASRELIIKSVMGPERKWTVIATEHGERPIDDVDVRVPVGPSVPKVDDSAVA